MYDLPVNVLSMKLEENTSNFAKLGIKEYPTIRLYKGKEGQYSEYHLKDDDSNLTE